MRVAAVSVCILLCFYFGMRELARRSIAEMHGVISAPVVDEELLPMLSREQYVITDVFGINDVRKTLHQPQPESMLESIQIYRKAGYLKAEFERIEINWLCNRGRGYIKLNVEGLSAYFLYLKKEGRWLMDSRLFRVVPYVD